MLTAAALGGFGVAMLAVPPMSQLADAPSLKSLKWR
jgi:hypothetical protein